MENQHRKIKGYRELTEDEIALMNMIKAEGEDLRQMLQTVQTHLDWQLSDAKNTNDEDTLIRIRDTQPSRWLAIARTHFQEGLMAATRAVAQPESF